MISADHVALSLLLAGLAYALWKAAPILLAPYTTGIRNLPGPPSASWLYGNLRELFLQRNTALFEQWVQEYGPNVMFKGGFGDHYFSTLDTRALNHILTHTMQYQRPEQSRKNLARVVGRGVLFTEGEQHRQQRRIMNPAFGPAQIREITEVFVQKSLELRGVWSSEIKNSGKSGMARIDVLAGLTRMTLDVIGLAGFNYRFDSLSGKETELSVALENLFKQPPPMSLMTFARTNFPILADIFPGKHLQQINEAQEVMRRVGAQLIEEKKAAIRAEMVDQKLGVERKDVVGRDLLTLLIKANMATDIPDNQRLSDEDVIGQVPTFIVAGHETTSGATTWALYALTQAPEVQRKLREELFTVETDTPTMDELSALPYLDAVVRETLRAHAPVTMVNRMATEDDVIPVAAPFVDRFGKTQDSIRISKGTRIIIPILAMNRAKELWGEDALEFKPERWESQPAATASIPGVWAHLMTFLGGPRACIGYRFSLIEMKALLFTLVRAFEFELAVSPEGISRTPTIVQRPLLKVSPEQGCQMPLLVRPHRRS